jgi:hypothetical protein
MDFAVGKKRFVRNNPADLVFAEQVCGDVMDAGRLLAPAVFDRLSDDRESKTRVECPSIRGISSR